MLLYADLLKARLVGSIDTTQTSITIDDASTLPSLSPGQYFLVKIIQDRKIEKMQCTEVSGNILTVTRATYYPYSFSQNAKCIISIDPFGYELSGGGSRGLSQQQILARQSMGF